MRGLIQLIARYGSFLLFLLLEVASLVLVVRYNRQQNEIFLNSWGLFTAYLEQQVDNVGDYYGLKKEVIQLQGRNIKLMEQLDNAKYSNRLFRDTIDNDTLLQYFTFVGANVISNSITSANNYLRLDRGSEHGIKPHMGVISDQGVVGIVRHVSPHFSNVMSLLHSQSRVKAIIKRNGYFGTLSWKADTDPRHINLEAIPKHAEIAQGDTILTSGFSQIFPANIPIGTIEDFWLEPGENFYNIEVKLYIDLSKIRYVYIVDHMMREEHDALDQAADE
jgi:rod shape-determining protein MreC